MGMLKVCLALFAWPLTSSALTEGNYNYTVANGQATITYFNTSYSGVLAITNTLGGNSVTSIGDHAFEGCVKLTSVTIPDSVTNLGVYAFSYCTNMTNAIIGNSVTSIGYYSFYNCSKLTSVTIPDGVTSIGNSAFKSCSSLINTIIGNGVTSIGDSAFYNCAKLTSVTIPDSVTNIGDSAFSFCTKLTNVNMGNGVTSIGRYAFSSCTSLTNAIIGSSVTSVGDSAFKGCSSLTNVTIPDSAISIGGYAFYNCTSLTNAIIGNSVTNIGILVFNDCAKLMGVTVGESNLSYSSLDGVLFSKNQTSLIKCPGGKIGNYTIPNSVTSIGEHAFYGCTSLTNAIIGNSVINIGNSAFSSCTSLTNAIIGNSVINIGNSAFSSCTSLTNAIIGNSVTSIGESTFNGCSSLTSITIPDSVISIGTYAFRNCAKLTSVTIPDSVTSIGGSAFGGCTKLTFATIGNGVTNLGAYAFSSCTSLTNAIIGNSVTSIGDSAFSDCTSLTNAIIGNSVTSIGWSAFYNCAKLASVTIPTSVTSMGDSAFKGCTSLTNAIIGNSVISIGDNAYYNCAKLASVTIPTSVTSMGAYAFFNCDKLASVTIPASVTNLGAYAFSSCTSLTNAIIGNSVASIGHSTFSSCTSLASVTIPNCVTSIGGSAFFGCTSLTSVTIPNCVTSIGFEAFSGCTKLTFATIGNGVTSIGDSAFNNCAKLTSVTIPDSVTSIGGSAFAGCTKLTSVTIPDSVTSIGGSAFAGCTKLTCATIGNGVTNLGANAFSTCTSLTNAIIGNSVNSIGRNMFYNCSNLTSVTIPDSVIIIGDNAFYNCTSLTSVIIGNSVTSIGLSVFSGCTSLTNATIGNSVISIGNFAFSGCSNLTSVTIPASVSGIWGYAFSGSSSQFKVDLANAYYSSTDGVLFNKTKTALIRYPGGYTGNYIIPNSVTSIGDSAFSYCYGLASVTIPASVTSIGDDAFYNCVNLMGVYFIGKAPSVSNNTFYLANLSTVCHLSGATGWPAVPSLWGGRPTALWYPLLLTVNKGVGGGWYANGSQVVIEANAAPAGYILFDRWTGATQYVTSVTSATTTVTIPENGISITATYCLSALSIAGGVPMAPSGITNAVRVATDNSGDGGTAVKLGGVGLLADGQMAGIEWTVTGPGVLAFDWKVSSEADYDWLRFYEVGGAMTNRISGTTGGWSRVYAAINGAPNTVHVFRWEYEKDPVGDYVGSDCGWVDAVSWSPFYTLTVNQGLGNGAYTNATVLTIMANAPPQWHRFDRWTGDTNSVANALSSTTTLVMPATGIVVTATYTPILYTLTVVNGSGGSSYSNGATLAIVATAPPAHYEFNRWTGDTNGVANVLASSTTLLMLGTGAVVTATYKPIYYPVTVNSGTGGGTYTNGSVVAITADSPPAHYAFDRWTGDTSGVADVFAASTILTVPTGVTIIATYKPILYAVGVSGGLGDGSYAYGTQLELTAAIYEGKRFYRWSGTTNNVADVTSPTTTVFIAGESLSLTSLYCVPLTVNTGTGSGWYVEGTTARIAADLDPIFKEFDIWTGDGAGFLADAAARTTAMTMPSRPTSVTATYRDSVARVAGCYGRTFTISGTAGGLSTDASADSPSGTPAVKLGGAGVLPDNGFTVFETVVSGSGTVTFWWRVSSEIDADYLKFRVDGVLIAAISGTKGPWAQMSYRVDGTGVSHILRWGYGKNGSLASSTDAGWVDDIIWTGDIPEPVIVPDIHAIAATDGLFTIGFQGERGIPYTVYSNATLNASGWAPMATVPQEQGETNGLFRFLVTAVPSSGQSSCFYRMFGGAIPPLPDMVLIQGGSLTNIGNGAITVSSFYIGKYEVTWAEWQTVRDWATANGYDFGSVGAGSATNHPVQMVNWYDCVKWCNALSQKEGLTPVYYTDAGFTLIYKSGQVPDPFVNVTAAGYRLPTESEWEFAARGGKQSLGNEYSGGSDLNEVGWCLDNSSGAAVDLYSGRGTWPVGTKAANELGLFDMTGNVWEWCFDWYPGYEGSCRVYRGGSWGNFAISCRSAYRCYDSPIIRNIYLGFRAARSLP
jgi:hypothetical protein